MCDQANHDNCEIIDELYLTISNLEMTIADLKAEFLEDLKEFELKRYSDMMRTLTRLREKWEAK